MREAREESDLERYQRSLRDRASKSIHQLKYALGEEDPAVGESEVAFEQSSTSNDESGETAWQELQHSHAVNQLKALLREQGGLESEVSPSRRRKMSPSRTSNAADQNLPTLCDLVPIINDQSQYIHHLEAEVKFCKEELSGMKDRIRVVVLENEKLHEEMKSLTVEQTLREQTLLDASANARNSWTVGGDDSYLCQPVKSSPSHNKEQVLATTATAETEKWQLELEKLKLLYQERIDTLEAQVRSLRKDLSESEKNCEDLKGRLKHQDSLIATSNSNRVGGLCLKCAQHEAVLSQTHSSVHMQTIERLTKERDDLMGALVSVRRNLSEMQQRESSAYEQVKQAVQMTEEANLEKMKALVQCEQLKSEMERQKDRLERELIAQLDKRAGEKEALRGEMKKEREDLASTVMVLSQNVATLEARLERITREKNSIANQLEEAQNQLASQEMEVNKEIEKLGLELNENKLRLEQAQQDAARAKDECLKLTELLGKSEHQLHLTRLEKESIQHSLSNEAKTRALQAEQREQELTQKMQQMEAQHDKTVNELDSLLTSQNTFIAKLKEECCTLARKLEHVTEKNRSEVSQLSQENEYVNDRLEKMQKRNDELEEQCIQHGRMHERMKLRLYQLDKHCQTTAQQLVELLNKQNQLFRERQMLTEEVQFLRTQLPCVPV
ncbi:serologically defined colon cancer antigen 8 isoform X4 [Dermochelys coriacea]|uniref:serologically defined colon cancer antigen 8 isoform X4 n=1 Tax=Dermochelys coriacea TaxID=27794 RepID=UPI0018E8D1CA|nr:serologically defined colon cancer antigen 8 isoform X4 [Dermochelys coriacea]